MNFDYQWTAPNGVPIVVQTVKFPDGTRQIVGVYNKGQSPPGIQIGSGWGSITGLITFQGGTQADFSDTAAKVDFRQKRGDVFYYFDGDPVQVSGGTGLFVLPQGGTQLKKTMQTLVFNPGWYARTAAQNQKDQLAVAQMAAYQWGVQQLASLGSTPSSVANSPPGASPTPAQNVPPAAPGTPPASSTMTYLLVAAAAAAGWFLFKPSSAASA